MTRTNLSQFGEKFTRLTGINELMKDLSDGLSQESVRMLGGGTPAHIPGVENILRKRMQEIVSNTPEFNTMMGDYDGPQGNLRFISALAGFLKRTYGWNVTGKNIILTNGSQNSFFYLFNTLAGSFSNGTRRKILFPVCPEYIGYADIGIEDGLFTAARSEITYIDDHTFKYAVDFNEVNIDETIAAVCVSRPTNPTGNVITDEEVAHLSKLTREAGIPLILDNAYGVPFPGIIFTDATPYYDEHVIVCMSLSKLGLPGTRTGIVVAHEDIINTIACMNAIASLAPGSIGATMMTPFLNSGEILTMSTDIVRPFYRAKVERAANYVHTFFNGLPYCMHKPEGALFLWLWFKDFPITSQELYECCKKRGVIIVPGHYFFPGFTEDWKHTTECIRVTYAQKDDDVREGLKIIAEEVKKAYSNS